MPFEKVKVNTGDKNHKTWEEKSKDIFSIQKSKEILNI